MSVAPTDNARHRQGSRFPPGAGTLDIQVTEDLQPGSVTLVTADTINGAFDAVIVPPDTAFDRYVYVEEPDSLRFVTTSAADENDDGLIDILDLLFFLSNWFNEDASADRDGEPGVTVLDLLVYLDVWFRDS